MSEDGDVAKCRTKVDEDVLLPGLEPRWMRMGALLSAEQRWARMGCCQV